MTMVPSGAPRAARSRATSLVDVVEGRWIRVNERRSIRVSCLGSMIYSLVGFVKCLLFRPFWVESGANADATRRDDSALILSRTK